jgi:putative transcriptional regulator
MSKNKKPKRLFERLKEALEEGIGDLRGEIKLKSYDVEIPDPPPVIDKRRVLELRNRLNLSQQMFARLVNVAVSTVRLWETGKRRPTGAAARLLQVYSSRPEIVDFIKRGQLDSSTNGKAQARATANV